MNKDRRKKLIKVVGTLRDIKESLEDICDEEQKAEANVPANLQRKRRGLFFDGLDPTTLMKGALEDLNSIIDSLEYAAQ